MNLILPESTIKLIGLVSDNQRHAGLQLDKFSIPGDQRAQKTALERVCRISGDPDLLNTLNERRRHTLESLPNAATFCCTTTSPLTLHLSRASALENTGICLHPLCGFVYLPGSGLKGMARAYAVTVWQPTQPDQKQAGRNIEDVFGKAPNHPAEVRRQNDMDPDSPEIKSSSGNIVFHDAWPKAWPQLIVDIINNHHPDYYQHDDSCGPGDWEKPEPVYFLAVKVGTTFTFPLAKRRTNVSGHLLDLAREWLLGALCHLGAGAKTNAGYGAFKPISEETSVPASQKCATFETTLELVTPAFLAGACQQKDDCDLRPPTLRGLLRWWWRTMYAGFLDVKTLRALEAAIWGDTREGGAVRIVIEPVDLLAAQPYEYDKMTQGLRYLSFGMKERFYLEAGTRWHLKLIARRTRFFMERSDVSDPKKTNQGKLVTAEQVLRQAKTATYLLCHFGAVGSKARKGFGSLTADNLNDWESDKCKETAEQLRQSLELSNNFDEESAHSSSLHQMLDPMEVSFFWPNIWDVLDQIGFAYQAFAKEYKNNLEKKALGLPRHIEGHQGSFDPTPPVTSNGRHSSPVHIHIDRLNDNWHVRAVAFPAAHLPNLSTSQAFLKKFLKDFGEELQRRVKLPPPPTGPGQSRRQPRQPVQTAAKSDLPKPGDHVEAVLLEEKTHKGGWKAKHIPSGLVGPIQNTADVPPDKRADETVRFIVASVTESQIAFQYPTPSGEERAQRVTRKNKGKHGSLGRR